MVRVAVLGATGRTGQRVVAAVLDDPRTALAGAFASDRSAGLDVGTLLGRAPMGRAVQAIGPALADADAVIDFSLPEALDRALPHLGTRPLVSGTTGLPDALQAKLDARQAHAAVLQAPNFSPGVQVLMHLAAQAAAALPEADIEVVEVHHRNKLDSPSGTANALVRAAADARGWDAEQVAVHGRSGRAEHARDRRQIGVHSVRSGAVVGDHDLSLSLDHETLTLSHRAHDRGGFARGAIRAAVWLAGQPPGSYQFAQVLGLL